VKEKIFAQIVKNEFGDGIKPVIDFNLLIQSKYYSEIIRVYRSLGGILSIAPSKPGKWDIITANFIIELDEENHFNRYREMTLRSSFYNQSNLFSISNYKSYCAQYEKNVYHMGDIGRILLQKSNLA